MNSLHTSQNTQETSTIDLSENTHYREKEKEFLAWCQKRISIFLETHDIPEEIFEQILSQIPDNIKKSPITIVFHSGVIESYKVEFFLDSSFESEIVRQTEYFIWKKNMEKYIQTPASLTPRILKVLAYNKVENISNLSVEDFLSRFHLFSIQAQESLFQEKTTLEKHSQRVIQAHEYLLNIDFISFSIEKIRQDGWYTDFYKNVQFPEIEQKSTVLDTDFKNYIDEIKKNEPQPFYTTEKLKVNPTKEVEKTTRFTVATLLFAGALVTGSIYNLQSIDDNKSQENVPSAIKFNESGFQRAFQDMIYSQMQKGNDLSEIEKYVEDHAGRIAYEHGLDASLYKFNLAIVKDEVVLKLQQYGQVMYQFKVQFGTKYPYYTDYFYDAQFSEELKMYLSIALDDFKMKSNQKDFLDNVENYLYEKMAEYVRVNQGNGKYSPFKGVISRNYNEIKIEFIFTKADETINYQTELIIHL